MRALRHAALACAFAYPVAAPGQQCQEQRLASPNGPGVTVTTSCVRHEGVFRDRLLHGKGKITYRDNWTEEGDFIRGRLWGAGRIQYSDGRTAEGDFVDGRMSGQGKLTWPDGRVHEGMFHNGSPAGPGRFLGAKGEISEGMFDSRGNLDGRGIRTLADGTKLFGEFRDNRPVGEVLVVKPDGAENKQAYTIYGQPVQQAGPAAAQPATQPAAQTGSTAPPDAGQSPGSGGQVIQEVDRAIRGLRGIFGK